MRPTFIALMGVFLGELAMAQQPFYHQEMLDAFKREIRFEQLLQKLPEDKRVLVDWEAVLREVKDTEGTVWRGVKPSVYGMASFGLLSDNLKSDKGVVGLKVYSLPKGQRAAIEEALRNVATTSMHRINKRIYEPCFADFCLAPKDSMFYAFFSFVYGNLYVGLNYIELHDQNALGENVLPLARALHTAMQKAVAANPEGKLPARPRITYTVNPARAKAGETFTITVKFGEGAKLDPHTFDVAQDLLSNNIEYEEDLGGGVFKFTAKAPGMGTAAFSLLDKKTLWVFTDTVTVHVDPTK